MKKVKIKYLTEKKNEVKRIFFLFLASIIGTVIGITAAVLLGN